MASKLLGEVLLTIRGSPSIEDAEAQRMISVLADHARTQIQVTNS